MGRENVWGKLQELAHGTPGSGELEREESGGGRVRGGGGGQGQSGPAASGDLGSGRCWFQEPLLRMGFPGRAAGFVEPWHLQR